MERKEIITIALPIAVVLLLLLGWGCADTNNSQNQQQTFLEKNNNSRTAGKPADATAWKLPQVVAPFAVAKNARQKFILKADHVIDRNGKQGFQPRFESGNKILIFHKHMFRDFFSNPAGFTIMVNGQDAAAVNCSGWIPDVGGGMPFKGKDDSPGETVADFDDQSIRFTKEIITAKDKTAKFSYYLKSIGDGKLKLDWKLGLSPKEIAALPPRSNLRFDIIVTGKRTQQMLWVDNQKIPPSLPQELRSRLGNSNKTITRDMQGKIIRLGVNGPTEELSIETDTISSVRIEESFSGPENTTQTLVIRVSPQKLAPSGSLLLDLGATAVLPEDAPTPVSEVDFWKHDRMHVPATPTRNILPNPSFEQGMRYWTWRVRGGGSLYCPDLQAAPCYEITDDAKFGHHALKINATQGNRGIVTFPLPVKPGDTYTLSVYAKGEGLTVGVVPALPVSGQYNEYTTFLKIPASREWKRSSLTFKSRLPAERLELQAHRMCIVDGLQIEKGNAATEFVAPVVEGWLVSADPDNCLKKGKPFDLALKLTGKPGLKGKAKLRIYDYYREARYAKTFEFQLDASGMQTIPVPAAPAQIGTGVFVARVDYATNEKGGNYTDYYRFSVLDFLENKHATKNIFGLGIHASLTTRGDDLGAMYKRWGFGSTTYQNGSLKPEFYQKYGISNMLSQCTRAAFSPQWLDQPLRDIFFTWEEMTPEREKIVEDIAYKAASNPQIVGDIWAFNTESEGHTRMYLLGKYDEFIKLQMAARRGIKRARPNAVVLPDGGTSGFKPGRGYDVMENELKASQGKVQWDGLAIHPYGCLDDMDDSIRYLIGLDEKYNPGVKTPIYVPECSPGGRIDVPEWEKFSQYYVETSGRPSYDTGWREFDGTAISARLYLIGLKYWPRVRDVNQWIFRPFLDMYFAPEMICGTTNTLGHLLGNPRFIADYEPVAGIKGLVFEDDRHRGIAAVWTNAPKVEAGVEQSPGIRIRTNGSELEFIDLMGNIRTPEVINGEILVPLSPAPLFIRTIQPGKSVILADMLKTAEIVGSGSVATVVFLPTAEGKITASITNQTANPLAGTLTGKNGKIPINLTEKSAQEINLSKALPTNPGHMYTWKGTALLSLSNGYHVEYQPELAYFYVPKVVTSLPLEADNAAWTAVPSIPITNFHTAPGVKSGYPGDLKADFKMAWDNDFLYLRVECWDDKFLADMEAWKNNIKRAEQLWQFDGCVEVYFDTFVNGRAKGEKCLDSDDYRYDFYAKDGNAGNGACSVYRLHEVFLEYAGGPLMPTMQDVQNGGIRTQFTRIGNHYSYIMIFPQKYLLPFKLQSGKRTGFGLYIQDRDERGKFKGLSLATEKGQACNLRPDLWPIMILSRQTVENKK